MPATLFLQRYRRSAGKTLAAQTAKEKRNLSGETVRFTDRFYGRNSPYGCPVASPTAMTRLRSTLSRISFFLLFLFTGSFCFAQDDLFGDSGSLLPQSAAQAHILYFASTRGELHPCPT